MIDICKVLRSIADLYDSEGLGAVNAEDDKWYTFSCQIMPINGGGEFKVDSTCLQQAVRITGEEDGWATYETIPAVKKRWWRR